MKVLSKVFFTIVLAGITTKLVSLCADNAIRKRERKFVSDFEEALMKSSGSLQD